MDNMIENRTYWMHRISYEREIKQALLDMKGMLMTGWGLASTQFFLDSVYRKDKQVFDIAYEKVYGCLPHNRFFLYMFLNEFKKGDYVLVPGFKDFSVYEIISDFPFPKEQIWDNVGDVAEVCNLERRADGIICRKDTHTELELGFFWKVKLVEKSISRELYAMDSLRRRMKFQGTDNNLTLLGHEVEEAIRRYREDKPLNLRQEITKDVSCLVLQKLQAMSSDRSFEKVVEYYLKRIGATRTIIPAKTLLGKEQGDADVVADFDELQVRTIVQVKHYLKEVDETAVRQIVDAKSCYDDANYTLILWVVAACDSFTEQAQRYAEENGVRLIGGSDFASSLLDVGLGLFGQ